MNLDAARAVLRDHFDTHGDDPDLDFDTWLELSLDHVDVDDLTGALALRVLNEVDEAWLVLATEDPTPDGLPPTVDLSQADFRRDIGMARDYLELAVRALADEHEGNFKHYLDQANGLVSRVHAQAQAM